MRNFLVRLALFLKIFLWFFSYILLCFLGWFTKFLASYFGWVYYVYHPSLPLSLSLGGIICLKFSLSSLHLTWREFPSLPIQFVFWSVGWREFVSPALVLTAPGRSIPMPLRCRGSYQFQRQERDGSCYLLLFLWLYFLPFFLSLGGGHLYCHGGAWLPWRRSGSLLDHRVFSSGPFPPGSQFFLGPWRVLPLAECLPRRLH